MLRLIVLLCLTLFGCDNSTIDHKNESTNTLKTTNYSRLLDSLKIVLPEVKEPIANYVHITQADKILYLSGKGPKNSTGQYIKGKLGLDISIEEGYEAARAAGIIQLAVLKDYLGDLNKVKQILKVQGMVNATPDFKNHPEVINGYSDLMVEVFGDRGKHARAAVGMSSLPRNICVEIDMIVEIY